MSGQRKDALEAARRIEGYHRQGTDIDVPIEYRIDALTVARALLSIDRRNQRIVRRARFVACDGRAADAGALFEAVLWLDR